jgi:hypothetical protein
MGKLDQLVTGSTPVVGSELFNGFARGKIKTTPAIQLAEPD